MTSLNALWVANADQIYHTQFDTMAYADPEPIKITLDLYALLAIRSDHALVLPFNLALFANWAGNGLVADKTLAPSEAAYFDTASAALTNLKAQIASTNTYADSHKASYATATDSQKADIEAQASALNQKLFAARKVIITQTMGEGGTAASWDIFVRTHQHANDLNYLNSAVSVVQRNQSNALKALESVYSMEWGHYFSTAIPNLKPDMPQIG